MGEITFRRTKRQRLMTLLLGTFIGVEGIVILHHLWLGIGYIAFMAGGTALSGKFGVTLTTDGITVRGYTRKFIAWHEIRRMDAYSLMGTRCVRLHTVNGKKKRLPLPITGFGQKDPDYDAKAAAIHHWWLFYTGQIPQWNPETPELPTLTVVAESDRGEAADG